MSTTTRTDHRVGLDPVGEMVALARRCVSRGEHEQACEHLVAAAEIASAVTAGRQEALALLDEAIALPVPGECRARVAELRARVASEAASGRAAEAWRECVASYEAVEDCEGMARALYHLYWVPGAEDPALLSYAAGLSASGWGRRCAALERILAADYVEAASLDHEAVAHARAAADLRLESLALTGLAVSLQLLGQVNEAEQAQERAIALATRLGDHRAVMTGFMNLVVLLADSMRLARALAQADRARAHALAYGLAEWQPEVEGHRSWLLWMLGRIDESREAARLACRALSAGIRPDVRAAFVAQLCLWVAIESGDEALAARCIGVLAASDHLGLSVLAPTRQLASAMLAEAGGDIDGAFVTAMAADPCDATLCAQVALWLARAAAVHDRPGALARASELANRIGDAAALQVLAHTMCEIDALVEACASGSTNQLTEVARSWQAAGMPLEAARCRVAAAAIAARAGDPSGARAELASASGLVSNSGALLTLDHIAAVELTLSVGACSHAGMPPLGQMDWLAQVGTRARRQLEAVATRIELAAGERLARDGDPQGALYVVREGGLVLVREEADGTTAVVERIGPGMVIGEGALQDGGRWNVTVETTMPTVLDAITAGAVREIVATDPALALAIAGVLSLRAERQRGTVAALAGWQVERRIASLLLELDADYGHPTLGGERLINRPLTNVQLAQLVAARRETVGEVLKRLRESGIIDQRRRRIVVRDMAALSALARG